MGQLILAIPGATMSKRAVMKPTPPSSNPGRQWITADEVNRPYSLAEINLLLEQSQWKKAIEAATQSLNEGLEPASEFYLRRGIAYVELKALSDAMADIRSARAATPRPAGSDDLLLRALRILQQWPEVLAVLDDLLKELAKEPVTAEAISHRNQRLLQRVDALRYLGRQEDALRAIELIPTDRGNVEQIRLNAALRCDIGDFPGALECLVPATSPLPTSTERLLLVLRGWAHQNCLDGNHALDAEKVYRRVLALKPDDWWSRKGLANALRRQGQSRRDEADRCYGEVIAYAEQKKAENELNPYDSCLAGWCLYCTGRFKEGADFYAAGLSAIGVGAAAQFDYGLILLSDSRFSAAKDQFERSIQELETKNSLRRCGLLYVALFDLRDALQANDRVAQAQETYLIQAALVKAMEETLLVFPPGWEHLAERMDRFIGLARQDADSIEARIAAMLVRGLEDVDWSSFHLVGFSNSDWALPCAVLTPIVSHKKLPERFFSITESGSLIAAPEEGMLSGENLENIIVRIPSHQQVSASSSILWVSDEMLDVLGPRTLATLAEPCGWVRIASPVSSLAATTTREIAERVRTQWAEQLVEKSLELLAEHFRMPGETKHAEAERATRFALAAASNPAAMKKRINEFKSLLQLQSSIFAPEPASQEKDKTAPKWQPSTEFIREVFDRVNHISQIEDKVEQYKSAVQTSREMKLLVPLTENLKPVREKLAEELEGQDKFYLSDDDSILVISREPAFYTSSVLLSLSQPAVYSFAFFEATNQMQKMALIGPTETLRPTAIPGGR